MTLRVPRVWIGRATMAIIAAVTINVSLSVLAIDHDAPLVALLTATTFAAGTLALETIDAYARLPWMAPRPDARPNSGEDLRTATFRHLIEVHETSREHDDTVLWQIADLANRRLRQVHGIRFADDPKRVTELCGPFLAELVSRDRRHRYQPGVPHPRYTVAELGELVRRIEDL